MKKTMIKVLSLAMALTLVASLAACGGKGDEETTAADDTTVAGDVVPGDDATEADVTGEETPSGDVTDVATEFVTDAQGHTKVVTQNPDDKQSQDSNNNGTSDTLADKTSLTTAEAVDLFNKATVGVKKNGTRTTAVDLVEVPGGDLLRKPIQSGLASSLKPTAITATPNQKMNASDFSSVSAKKSGNNWVITLNVKNETAPNTAANSRAFAELPQKDIDSWVGEGGSLKIDKPQNVKFVYNGGTIDATVTPDGKLVSAIYTMKVNVSVTDVKALGVVSVKSAKVNVTQIDKF